MSLTASLKGEILAAISDVDDPQDLREIAEHALSRARTVGKRKFAKGDTVSFVPPKGDYAGKTVKGTIKRVSQKTCTIVDLSCEGTALTQYRQWRVPFSMLSHA